MPIWLYEVPSLVAAIAMILFVETLSLVGLALARRFLLPHFHYGDGINDAISGTVQAIGVFYGITVGLIAIAVWTANSNSADLVSKEASSIGALYRDVGGYPEPIRSELRSKLREYTVTIIEKAWPAQRAGRLQEVATKVVDEFQARLFSFDPATSGQSALHAETLRAYNNLIEARRLRIDAIGNGLSSIMWAVIWLGAAISIGVVYLFKIDDPKMHAVLVALVAGFLALVLFMIVINDKPFFGNSSLSPDPYKIILNGLIDASQ